MKEKEEAREKNKRKEKTVERMRKNKGKRE